MRILKLLNKKYLAIIFVFSLLGFYANGEEQPIDIWNIDKKKIEEKSTNNISISDENKNEQIIQ